MLNFTKEMLLFPIVGMASILFTTGCVEQPPLFPETYDRNEISLSNTTVALAGKIYRETGSPAKIQVISNDNTFDPPHMAGCDKNSKYCAYVYSNDNPDLIVRLETVGVNGITTWTESQTTSGYYPIHTRFGFNSNSAPYIQNAWRQIELTESLKSISFFDRYFPEASPASGLAPTRMALAGHLRFFINHQDLFSLMADNIEAQSPDYVFMLGDFNRSDRLVEYIDIENNFMARLSTTSVGKTIYLPGNHEMENIRLLDSSDYERGLFYERYPDPYYPLDPDKPSPTPPYPGIPLNPDPELIQTDTVNILPIHSGGDSLTVMSDRMDRAAALMVKPELPTIVLAPQRIWTTWLLTQNWVMPDFKASDIMPLLTFQEADGVTPRTPVVRADVIVDGDSQDEISTGVLYYWDSLPWASVGMDSQIYFSVVTMGQDDRILRIRPFYLDLPTDHQYYKDALY